MSDTYSYEVLEPGGHARLVGNVLDRISRASANPSSAVGSASALLGDPETASWMERTTAADGAALIESVKGNTLRWNQLINHVRDAGTVIGDSITVTVDGMSVTFNGTASDSGYIPVANQISFENGHKYLVSTSERATPFYCNVSGGYTQVAGPHIFTCGETATGRSIYLAISSGDVFSNTVFRPQLFDLTAMFGLGNEPATVAEFEALFPEPYYPYDPGSLLPVRMEGIETVGFNQWDEVAEDGYISDTTGENVGNSASYLRSKDYIPVFPSVAYHFTCTTGNKGGKVYYYDADKAFLSFEGVNCNETDKTTPANARYMRFWLNYPGSYNHDICINLSDPSHNGTYEPYWSSQRTIPAATYFPGGMRSAGSVRDELRTDAAVTRVGAVDLGTLTWSYQSGTHSCLYATLPSVKPVIGDYEMANLTCVPYASDSVGNIYNHVRDKVIGITTTASVWVYDSAYTDAATFKAAMSGVMLHYALDTPTTTPIDPPLPMSYRVGADGTERVMVASGTTSAPPIFATRYPLDPADLAASIAPVDGPIAKTNHQVGDLIMLGFTLCKATQVIVTGETIAIGTNVTKTTVAAELAALS